MSEDNELKLLMTTNKCHCDKFMNRYESKKIGCCESCYEDIMMQDQMEYEESQRMVQVSADMASDACDSSLEGQWIRW